MKARFPLSRSGPTVWALVSTRPGLLGGCHVASSLSPSVTERRISEVQLPYGIARWRLDQHVHLRRHRLRQPPCSNFDRKWLKLDFPFTTCAATNLTKQKTKNFGQ